MAGQEIGVQMRQEHVGNAEAMLVGKREVSLDVALRVDDGGDVRVRVTDQVRRMGQTVEIELLENH